MSFDLATGSTDGLTLNSRESTSKMPVLVVTFGGTTPSDPTTSTSASFTFHATETGSTFACSLDGGAYAWTVDVPA